jgi:membrane protease YdiL (CAAX protease family)
VIELRASRCVRVDRSVAACAVVAVVAACAFLSSRPWFASGSNGALLLAFGYVLVLSAATLAPVPPAIDAPAGPTASLAVCGTGVAAVLAAQALVGPAVRWPMTAWAPAFNVVAAVAEEALFRRLAFGWLERHGRVVAVAVTAFAFAIVHVPVYGPAVFPVDLGAGLLLSWQRASTGRWSVPAATHVAANLLVVMQ